MVSSSGTSESKLTGGSEVEASCEWNEGKVRAELCLGRSKARMQSCATRRQKAAKLRDTASMAHLSRVIADCAAN